MELALEELRHRHGGRAAIARVEAKRSPELAERYGITCLPTILVFLGGHVVRRFLGTALRFELEETLEEWAPRGGAPRADALAPPTNPTAVNSPTGHSPTSHPSPGGPRLLHHDVYSGSR